MAKITINCNLDRYSSADFPQDLTIVPRVGEYVEVINPEKFKYPYTNRLIVCTVTHRKKQQGPIEYQEVIVDVWYDQKTIEHLHSLNLDI